MSSLMAALELMLVGQSSYSVIIPILSQLFDKIDQQGAGALFPELPILLVSLLLMLLISLLLVLDPSMLVDAATFLGALSSDTIAISSTFLLFLSLAPMTAPPAGLLRAEQMLMPKAGLSYQPLLFSILLAATPSEPPTTQISGVGKFTCTTPSKLTTLINIMVAHLVKRLMKGAM